MYKLEKLNVVRIADDDKTRQKLITEGYREVTEKPKGKKADNNGAGKA